MREANEVIGDLLGVLVTADPKNSELAGVVSKAKALMSAHPEKLHSLIASMLLKPNKDKILACDESFINDIPAGDMLGLRNLWFNPSMTLEHKASCFFSLISLTNILT
jgi:hypothetical protein